MTEQGKIRSRSDMHRVFARAVAVAEDVSRSPQPRVSLEMGLLRLMEVEPSVGLETLLRRVDQLLAGGAGSRGRHAAVWRHVGWGERLAEIDPRSGAEHAERSRQTVAGRHSEKRPDRPEIAAPAGPVRRLASVEDAACVPVPVEPRATAAEPSPCGLASPSPCRGAGSAWNMRSVAGSSDRRSASRSCR